jgi:hypothetical protein
MPKPRGSHINGRKMKLETAHLCSIIINLNYQTSMVGWIVLDVGAKEAHIRLEQVLPKKKSNCIGCSGAQPRIATSKANTTLSVLLF